jgi:MFS family permease
MAVACGAHVLHDGYTDILYVMLPVWQAEFGLGFAALGLIKTVFSGTLAGFQVPSGLVAERLGVPLVLGIGTALAGLGYCLAGFSAGVVTLMAALFVAGLGTSTQHPLGSSLIAQAYAGARSRTALGTYNFAGDLGKMSLPVAASLLLLVLPWRDALLLLGGCGLVAGVAIYVLAPRLSEPGVFDAKPQSAVRSQRRRSAFGFPLLLSVGMIDNATRAGFLTFLPFVLTAKGASVPTVGVALTLVFAGGAAGKLVCTFVGARIGTVPTVWLTETVTAAGMLALLPLPLEAAMLLLPVIGVALNGTSSVLYGSVPDLVDAAKRARAFGVYYTGTIGASAAAPALYGLLGDAVGIPSALMAAAAVVLLTLPLTLLLRPVLAEHDAGAVRRRFAAPRNRHRPDPLWRGMAGDPVQSRNPEPTLTGAADAPMTAEQAARLRELAHDAYDFEAFSPHLTRAEADRRIAGLLAKIRLQGEPPHTQ